MAEYPQQLERLVDDHQHDARPEPRPTAHHREQREQDGRKEQRPPGVPLICMETALPAKFAATIREALGQEPARPQGFEDLEKLPQRYEVIRPDPAAVKRAIERHAVR